MKQRKDTWTERYADWCRRQGSTAQCNPVLLIPVFLVIVGCVIYVYRQLIITTILTAVLAAVGVAVFVGAVALTLNTVRWYRRRVRLMAADPSGATALASATDDTEVAAISAEADLLASEGMELVFDKDGNLHAKTGKL